MPRIQNNSPDSEDVNNVLVDESIDESDDFDDDFAGEFDDDFDDDFVDEFDDDFDDTEDIAPVTEATELVVESETESEENQELESESNEETEPDAEPERENSAIGFFDSINEEVRADLTNAFANVWRNMMSSAGGEQFQETMRDLSVRHSIALDHLAIYNNDDSPAKFKIAQEEIEAVEAEIAQSTAMSRAPEDMTLGMIRFALDLGVLIIQNSELDKKDELFVPGLKFNGLTFKERIDIEPARKSSPAKKSGVRTKNSERAVKPCDKIIIYEQNNNDTIAVTFDGREYGVRPLTNATIMLAEQEGSVFPGHGCTWSDEKQEYIIPPSKDCKDLPFTNGADGYGKAQAHYLASLACSTGRRVVGMYHNTLEFDMIPDGNGGLRIIDANGEPYRTGKIRTEAKTNRLNLID